MVNEKKRTTMSVREMGDLLGLKKNGSLLAGSQTGISSYQRGRQDAG